MTVFYTGVGSRRTPADVLESMRKIAEHLAGRGYVLRSGGAEGADTAFEDGAWSSAHIYLAWPGENGKRVYPARKTTVGIEALRMASLVHPVWHRLSWGAKKLHARNCYQVLGDDLKTPSAFLVCWTPDGCVDRATRTEDTGGTATAIVLAADSDIPVFNLQRNDGAKALKKFLSTIDEL